MIDKLKAYLQNNDSEKLIEFIISQPEVLDSKDENGSSGLMLIAYNGKENVLKKAIDLKKSFSFHEAIVCGKSEVVKDYLISDKSLVNKHSEDGFAPVSLAAFFDQTELARLMLDNGANPNLQATNPSKVNALHSAVAKENIEICKLLIERGVDVNASQTQNVTPLHSAAHRGNLELVKLLIENGADENLRMDNGDSALDIAIKEEKTSVKEYLKGISK